VVTRPLSPFDRRVYHQIAVYAPGEAVAWPSQQTIADDLGCSRYSVHRAIHRLIEAGWLEVTERRPGRRGWTYCVYALLAPFAVSRWAIQRVVERARRRRQKGLHTNPKGWKRPDATNGASQRSVQPVDRPGTARSATRGSP
jgi:DNA-binding transcriptional MocR family regulator